MVLTSASSSNREGASPATSKHAACAEKRRAGRAGAPPYRAVSEARFLQFGGHREVPFRT